MANLLVVVDDVAQVVAAGVVRLAHAHRVVREVDIAVVAEELGHGRRWSRAGAIVGCSCGLCDYGAVFDGSFGVGGL